MRATILAALASMYLLVTAAPVEAQRTDVRMSIDPNPVVAGGEVTIRPQGIEGHKTRVNGTEYTFQVRAVNRNGKSRASGRAEATPRAAVALDFAHFANGEGITSDLVFVNVATHPIRPVLYFYDQEGNLIDPESVVDVTGDLEIQEDGGLTVQTEMDPLGELTISTHGQGEVVSGSVRVVSNGPIGGVLRFDLPGIGVAGVGASPPVRDALFPARREVRGISTAAAVHNMEEEAIVVSCRLMSGGVVLEEMEISLAANGQEAQFIEEMFTTTDTSNFVGLVRCTGPGRFTGVAVELDAASRIFTTLPVVPVNLRGRGREAVLDFAHFANGEGITSDLVFVNVETQPSGPAPTPFHTAIPPIRPALYFYDKEGNPIAAETVVEITGDLEVRADGGLSVQTEMEPLGELTISTHGQGELVSGSVRVVSDGPIGGVLRFDLPGIGVAGVGASQPVRDALFPARREGDLSTAAAIHNPGEEATEVSCQLMSGGIVLEEAEIPLEANGQEARYIEELFPRTDTSDFVGSVRCTAPEEGMFTGVAVELDAGNRIFTTLPVAGGEEPKTAEGKGDDDDDGGVGSRLICVGNVRDVQTTVPAAAANYTVAYDRYLTPGCASYVNNRYFGKDVPWISYSSAANAGRLITYTVEANPSATSARTGNIWIIDIGNNNTPVGRTTITQERAQYAPTVELSCARCDDVLPNGEPIDLIVTASDGNGDEDILPNWEWSKVDANGSNAGMWLFGPSGRQWGPPDGVGRYTIGVTVTDTTGRTASDSVNIDVAIFCGAFVSGILTDEGDGTGFLSTAERGFLHFKLEEGSHASCPVTVSSFRSTETWVRGLSAAASTRVGWDRVIEFEVDANPTSVVRSADVWLELKAPYIEAFPSERITLQQAGVRRPAVVQTCQTTAITHTRTSWTVGDRYYGSGFTQPWAKMGYGEAGGCRASGLLLSQPGRVRICGYNVADADARGACVAAPRAAAATHSTDPTAGAVTTATGNTAAAQWVEFLVDEKTPTGGTLSLAVGTSSGGVYLHFGYEHESDLSYGDSDYERWNVGTPTWTFSPAASTTSGSAVTHPTLTEHGRYPGVFLVTCAASNGRPTGSDTNADTDDGFSVRVSAAQGSPSVTYTASAAHPTYPRICKP